MKRVPEAKSARLDSAWLEGSEQILYSDTHTLMVSLQTHSEQQLIKVFDINRMGLEPLFTVEIAAQGPPVSMRIQSNKDWIALGYSDQLLLYNLAQKQGKMLKFG